MNKVSNDKALSFIDSFLGKVTEKKAEESPINVKSSDVGGANLAGTVAAKVGGTTGNAVDKEEKAKEGAHGKEKSSDLAAAIPGTGVEDAKAENNESKDKERASVGDFGAEPTNDGGKDLAKEVQNAKVAEEQIMNNEMKRAELLGNKILQKVAAAKEAVVEAAPQETLLKQAADAAYHDFCLSYQYGLLKRAEDEAAIQQALGLSPEEASGMLDEVAAEDPGAVLPPEAMEGAPVEGMPAEGGAEEAGEPAAQELVEALEQLGISPEELEQAIAQVDQEGAPAVAEEAPAPEAAPAEGMEMIASEEDLQKQAAERHGALVDIVRNFRASVK